MTLAGDLALVVLLVCAVGTDWRERRIPNALVAWGALAGLLIAAIQGPQALWMALCGGLVGAVLLLPFYILRGMAAGDVKLAAMAGVLMGVPAIFYALLGTALAGGLMALVWNQGRNDGRCMPYAPAIGAGCCAALGLRWCGVF